MSEQLFPEDKPPGLHLVNGFIDSARERELIGLIDNDHRADWLPDLSRRVQHYGYKYDYLARRIDETMRLGPLPDWLSRLAEDVACEVDERIGEVPQFDQAIVNEYLPGEGIAAHIDCVPCFRGVVATVSLESPITMEFNHLASGRSLPQCLQRGSLALLTGPARYDWSHAIAKRKTDKREKNRIRRRRRVSITLRTVILD